jgi:RimJ/RimL family protein N-acetyltransferase
LRYVGSIEIRAAEDTDADAVARIMCAADDARVLTPEGILYRQRSRLPRARMIDLVVEIDSAVVATGSAGLNIATTTEGAGWAGVNVDPAHRGRGIGSALGERLLDHNREIGVTKVTCMFRSSEEGERWATARGWSRLLGGPLIAVDPRGVAEPELPDGYRCVAMSKVGPEAMYEAIKEPSLDEPSPVPFDAFAYDDFLRDWNEPEADLESSTAVLDADGKVVSFSFLNAVGNRASHGFAGTLRAHRGRGLATAAKCRTLRTAAERGVTRVTTANAEENEAMRAVNRKLGFEPVGETVIYGRDL